MQKAKGDGLVLYICFVVGLNMLVNLFLLLGVARMVGGGFCFWRVLVGALLGGLYGGACLIDGFSFLGGFLWRLSFMAIMVCVAFGMHPASLRRGVLFVLLHLALAGATAGVSGTIWSVIAAVCTLGLLGAASFFERPERLVPVELRHKGRYINLTALYDSGNTLTDPATGQSVLVVGSDIAQKLMDLTPYQLRQPVETMQSVPGLRLIPYKTIDRASGLLLGMRVEEAKIGKWKGSALIAFAPIGLDEAGQYQGLTGGAA